MNQGFLTTNYAGWMRLAFPCREGELQNITTVCQWGNTKLGYFLIWSKSMIFAIWPSISSSWGGTEIGTKWGLLLNTRKKALRAVLRLLWPDHELHTYRKEPISISFQLQIRRCSSGLWNTLHSINSNSLVCNSYVEASFDDHPSIVRSDSHPPWNMFYPHVSYGICN